MEAESCEGKCNNESLLNKLFCFVFLSGADVDIFLIMTSASRGAAAQSVTVKPTGCGFGFVSPLEEMKYLLKFIFPFLRSSVEAKRGVEFCHLTRNASRMWQKVGNGVSDTTFLLSTLLCAAYSVKLMIYYHFL